jgi:hypothetical protein
MLKYREPVQTEDFCADCGKWLDHTDDIESITGICRPCLGESPVQFDADDDIVLIDELGE